jgi:hypothetical protein
MGDCVIYIYAKNMPPKSFNIYGGLFGAKKPPIDCPQKIKALRFHSEVCPKNYISVFFAEGNKRVTSKKIDIKYMDVLICLLRDAVLIRGEILEEGMF